MNTGKKDKEVAIASTDLLCPAVVPKGFQLRSRSERIEAGDLVLDADNQWRGPVPATDDYLIGKSADSFNVWDAQVAKPCEEKTIPCFECEQGVYHTEYKDYPTTNGDGNPMICKNVPHEVCDSCGDIVFAAKGSREIERLRKKSGVIYRR